MALLVIILLVVAAASLFIRGRLRADDYGPMVALCPGPDYYGYRCDGGVAYTYINATNDTFLYELDGTVELELPFPFTFYGTTYTEVNASSNGNLQFGNSNPEYANLCLDEQPVTGMGDMIAPYWDDLDLRFFGFIETETIGEAPNRIFVVEWDGVPRYETPDELLTFEVQLFEGSNDIVFLYQEISGPEGGNGRKATIGLQSETQGLTLQFACNVSGIASATQLLFDHPDNPRGGVGLTAPAPISPVTAVTEAKGDTAELLDQLNLHGETVLADLHRAWLNQTPSLTAVWQRADLTGDGRDELVILRHSTARYPHLSQLILLSPDAGGQMTLLLDRPFSTRQQAIPKATIAHVGDLTADGVTDLLLLAPDTGHLFALTAVDGTPNLRLLPDQCQGSLVVKTGGEIVRNGCAQDGRVSLVWDGHRFTHPTLTP